MRRPLLRHLSEGGGGTGASESSRHGGSRRQQSVKEENELVSTDGFTWNNCDYSHHQFSCDLLKVPNVLNLRSQQPLSPESRLPFHR